MYYMLHHTELSYTSVLFDVNQCIDTTDKIQVQNVRK